MTAWLSAAGITAAKLYERNRAGRTYTELADDYGTTRSAVAGVINRYKSRMALPELHKIASLAKPRLASHDSAIGRQLAIVTDGQQRLESEMKRLRARGKYVKLLFAADAHLGGGEDLRCLHLAQQIAIDFEPHLLTAMNDAQDWQLVSPHRDKRSTSQRQLDDGDIDDLMKQHITYLGMFTDKIPGVLPFQLQGNHDNWPILWARENIGVGAESFLHDTYFKPLHDAGVAFQTRDAIINTVKLSPGLVVHHGIYASKKAGTVALNNIQLQAAAGINYNVITGHTHRFHMIPENGVYHYNAPCLCNTKPHYLNFRPNWQQGVLCVTFNPNGREVFVEPVLFHPAPQGELFTIWRGKAYQSATGETGDKTDNWLKTHA